MYFEFAMRDQRIGRFICERIAAPSGRWRHTQLVNKANANFFAEFLEPAPAAKARSNFERFLVEAGIFDEHTHEIHLELDDGWLTDAMRVAAQHEPNAARRRLMISKPKQYLVQNNLQGLVNATREELLAINVGETAIAEEDPLEDDVLDSGEAATDASRPWNRSRPRATDRSTASATLNLVARERAARSHWELEKLLADVARSLNIKPQYNNNIDMHFPINEFVVLAEMKSCHGRNLHGQVRRGISQLLEYRYRYRAVLGENVALLLLLETRPTGRSAWLSDYAASLGIVIAWKENDRIVTGVVIPTALSRVVFPVQ
jgi:hypothetical protein